MPSCVRWASEEAAYDGDVHRSRRKLIDRADGNLKIRFGDGTVKTFATETQSGSGAERQPFTILIVYADHPVHNACVHEVELFSVVRRRARDVEPFGHS